jgi:hypothetical protein
MLQSLLKYSAFVTKFTFLQGRVPFCYAANTKHKVSLIGSLLPLVYFVECSAAFILRRKPSASENVLFKTEITNYFLYRLILSFRFVK